MLKLPPKPAPWLRAVMPMLLALSLIGCAAPSASPAVVCPANPPPPALSEPMPRETYSASAQQRIQTWRQSLTGTPATPAR